MIETIMALGIMGGTFTIVSVSLGLTVKLYWKVAEHGRDIKFIKQAIGMNNNNRK